LASLTGVAAGRLPRFCIGVKSDAPQRFARQFIESVVSPIEPRDQLRLHAWCPKASYVIRDAGDCTIAIGLTAKEIANVVCHPRQVAGSARVNALVIRHYGHQLIIPASGPRRYGQ
jgi:hypothetical protein